MEPRCEDASRKSLICGEDSKTTRSISKCEDTACKSALKSLKVGVPIDRTIVFLGIYSGPLIPGNYHVDPPLGIQGLGLRDSWFRGLGFETGGSGLAPGHCRLTLNPKPSTLNPCSLRVHPPGHALQVRVSQSADLGGRAG